MVKKRKAFKYPKEERMNWEGGLKLKIALSGVPLFHRDKLIKRDKDKER
jgi:hypothetical protein